VSSNTAFNVGTLKLLPAPVAVVAVDSQGRFNQSAANWALIQAVSAITCTADNGTLVYCSQYANSTATVVYQGCSYIAWDNCPSALLTLAGALHTGSFSTINFNGTGFQNPSWPAKPLTPVRIQADVDQYVQIKNTEPTLVDQWAFYQNNLYKASIGDGDRQYDYRVIEDYDGSRNATKALLCNVTVPVLGGALYCVANGVSTQGYLSQWPDCSYSLVSSLGEVRECHSPEADQEDEPWRTQQGLFIACMISIGMIIIYLIITPRTMV